MAIFRRGDGWVARAYVNGKHLWLGTFATATEAEAAERLARQQGARGETVAGFADRWLVDYNRTSRTGNERWDQTTIRHYRYILNQFKREFGGKPLGLVDTRQARAWAREQPEAYVRALRAMFNDALGDGLVMQNPFARLRTETSKGRRGIGALTEAELEALADLAGDATFAAMIAVAGYSGIRPGEMFALEWENVGTDTLHVRRQWTGREMKLPKNKQARIVFLPEQARERLDAVPRRSHTVFVNRRGDRMNKGSLHYRWRPVVAAFEAALPAARYRELGESRLPTTRAGRVNNGTLPSMDFYELRHAAATILLRRGATPEEVGFQLGHTDQEGGALIRSTYGHLEDTYRIDRIRAAYSDAE